MKTETLLRGKPREKNLGTVEDWPVAMDAMRDLSGDGCLSTYTMSQQLESTTARS
jgi:hypothetical protein